MRVECVGKAWGKPPESVRKAWGKHGEGVGKAPDKLGDRQGRYFVSLRARTAPPVMPALSPSLEATISTPFMVPGMA